MYIVIYIYMYIVIYMYIFKYVYRYIVHEKCVRNVDVGSFYAPIHKAFGSCYINRISIVFTIL